MDGRFQPKVALRQKPAGLCGLCDVTDWEDAEFQKIAGNIMHGDPAHVFKHRKLWEFVKAEQAFRRAGVWHPEAVGLSVAAGCERLLFHACKHVGRVVASDVYGDGSFSGLEAVKSFMDDPASFSPYPFPKDRLRAVWMNALTLEFPDNLFDFAFCLSSIEHFGGFTNAQRAIQEMARVVRPGGVVVFATDCSLNGRLVDEVFSPREVKALSNVPGLALMEPLDFSVSSESTRHLIDMRRDDLETTPHINLRVFASVFTSVSVALKKEHPSSQGPRISPDERIRTVDKWCDVLDQTMDDRRSAFSLRPPGLVDRLALRLRARRWRIEERFAEWRQEFA